MNYFFKLPKSPVFSIINMTSDGLVMSSCHAHAEYELLFIESGSALIENSTQTTEVSGPAVIIHSPYTLHRANVTGYYNRFIIYFTRETLSRVSAYGLPFNDISNVAIIRLDDDECATLVSYCRRMIDKQKDAQLREIMFTLIMHELYEFRSSENTEEYSAERAYITDVRSYIAENYSAPLTLESLSDRFFVSRAKLVADFKQTTGCTVKNYITLIRIGNARSMLRHDVSIADTAAQCGYNSESNFSQAFRKSTGMSPREYVKRAPQFNNELSSHPVDFMLNDRAE